MKSSLRRKLDDNETLDNWIRDPKSNQIHQIAKRKDCHLEREQIRHVMLKLGWHCLEMLGRCVDTQMRVFREAFPGTFSKVENVFFEHIYLANPAFGDIPLLLLYDRFDFLREALLAVWDHPGDKRAMAIVHSMMDYYSTLISKRREGYRRYKQRAEHRNRGGRVAREETLSEDPVDARESGELNLFKEIAIRLAKERGFDCDFDHVEWEAKRSSESNDPVEFYVCCIARKFEEPFTVSRMEFEATGRKIIIEEQKEEEKKD
jgi:hypothetical protein